MIAKYNGTCTRTGKSYGPGTEITKGENGWEIAAGARTADPFDIRTVRTPEGQETAADLNKPVICSCVKTRPNFAAESAAKNIGAWTEHFMARSGETLVCGICSRVIEILPKAPEPAFVRRTAERRTCWECGGSFTYADCKRNGGVWNDSYCGC